MSITARTLIQGALKIIGVLDPVETMKPEQAADGLEVLNDMVDLWVVDNLTIYATTNVQASFSGASATIGPGGTFNTPRPLRINHGFYRKSGLDYRLEVLRTRLQYDSIIDKATSTEYPEYLWYDAQVPLGSVYVWSVPAGANLYHLNVDVQLSQFVDLDTAYEVPQGYRTGMKYELGRMLCPIFQVSMPPEAEQVRSNAMNLIRRMNVQTPKMTVDSIASEGARFNIMTNQFEA